MRLFIFASPSFYPLLGKGLRLLNQAMQARANPRPMVYMQQLAREHLGYSEQDHWLEVKNPKNLSEVSLSDYYEIILVWPDALGLNWNAIENKILATTDANSSSLTVLNGRRRVFPYTPATRRKVRLHRFLEKYWIGELLFSLYFTIITPILLLIDLFRGRK